MRKLTNREVEKGAILELFNDIENRTDNVIYQSIHELDVLNTNREKQGLPKKTRINRECVQRAITSINNDILSSLPEKAGGTLSEKGEKNVEQTPETKDLGVEII
jgi:hypothetical protein